MHASWPNRILCFALAVVLLALAVMLGVSVADDLVRVASGSGTDAVAALQKHARSAFPCKDFFVDLNGLWARVTGRRLCNGVYRRPDGMLVRAKVGATLDEKRCAAGIVALARDLERRNIRFIYVQLPGKPDRGGEKLLALTDALLADLCSNRVEAIDFRARYAGSDEKLAKWFFRTDHHWNLDAVLDASAQLCEKIGGDRSAYEPSKWRREVLPEWFLGSQGKRVGVCFGGIDDLGYWVENAMGDYLVELTAANGTVSEARGDFTANLDLGFAACRGNVHEENAYKICRGIGGLAPMVRHRHPDAPIARRVALVGDSFARPLEDYLAAGVTDVLAVDPRYPCGETTVREKVLAFRPDVVLLCLNPYAFVKNKGAYPHYAFCEFP